MNRFNMTKDEYIKPELRELWAKRRQLETQFILILLTGVVVIAAQALMLAFLSGVHA